MAIHQVYHPVGTWKFLEILDHVTAARAIIKYKINIFSYYHPLTQRNTMSQTQAPGTLRTGGGYQLKKYILGVIEIFSVFTYIIIVYLTSMNIVHYL